MGTMVPGTFVPYPRRGDRRSDCCYGDESQRYGITDFWGKVWRERKIVVSLQLLKDVSQLKDYDNETDNSGDGRYGLYRKPYDRGTARGRL
jgi:hypothetical protein